MSALAARAAGVLLPTYSPPPLTLVRGAGCTVWDDAGNTYLDLVAGIAVCAVGHCHPRVVNAITRQLNALGHVSNLYLTEPAVALAERLSALAGESTKTFFGNSGTEAVEAALKLARKRGRAIAPDKVEIVAATGSFHGRTFGSLSVTGQPAKQMPFEPLLPGVVFVPYGDTEAIRAAVGSRTAAVILEPILGEAGVITPPFGYLPAARAVATANDALLVFDEVQTGVGRTGEWFAWQRDGVTPDLMTLGKGLGGGMPIGACVAFGDAADVLAPGDHGSTFGGNPVVCAAALATLDVIAEDELLERARDAGERLAKALDGVSGIAEVRGVGLLRALGLADPIARPFETAARDAGFLVNAIGTDTIRLVPPLVLSDEEIDRFVDAVAGLTQAAAATVSG